MNIKNDSDKTMIKNARTEREKQDTQNIFFSNVGTKISVGFGDKGA